MQPAAGCVLARAISGAAPKTVSEITHPARRSRGVALLNLSRKVEGPEKLLLSQEAVDACHAASTVRTQASDAGDWAATQDNLGSAMLDLGIQLGGEAGVALLDQAVTACRTALQVRTHSAHPADWAGTQENLGLAFKTLAELEPENAAAHLDAAPACLDLALQVFDPVTMPFNFQKASAARARAMAALAALKPG